MEEKTLTKSARFFLQVVNNLLWPAVCFNCKTHISETDNNLCRDCWGELLSSTGGYYCRRCGNDTTPYAIVNNICPNCRGKEFHFDSILRAGVYSDTLRDLILKFKNSHSELDITLGQLANSALQSGAFIENIDYIVPVPLHWKRRLIRGYNQSELIAKRLRLKSTPVNTDFVRIRNTAAQPTMPSPTQRARNVAGAFAVREGHNFEGKNICLVDDIKTTGATLNECAKTLKEAGAEKVYALVLAVAGQNI
ncbi:MAG: ComF family protein [Sedimentisphaerales bacterium]|nr:ComF family protein [Sedimentisphaerales bacterium]